MLKKARKATGTREKESTRKKGGGVSLDDEDAIDSGLFASGPAVIKESLFVGDYDYGGHSKPTVVWLLTFGRDGEEDYEQPYSLGKGWKVSADGKTLIAKAGQSGLPKSCNAMLYLIKPLKKALADADIEIDLRSGDPTLLDGLEVVVARVDQEKRNMGDNGKRKKAGEEEKDRTILVIEEVTGTEGDTSAGKKTKKKKKPAADEDDEDEEETEDDADESDDEDESEDEDEEDEKPKRGAKKKPAAKAKKKPAVRDEDEDEEESEEEADEDEDEASTEDAVEAIIDAVGNGPVKLVNLEAKLTKVLKGNKQAAAIIELATSKAFLKKEKGWTFDGKIIDAEEE